MHIFDFAKTISKKVTENFKTDAPPPLTFFFFFSNANFDRLNIHKIYIFLWSIYHIIYKNCILIYIKYTLNIHKIYKIYTKNI